mmetsp:Transcript_20527/g.42573  ORF Transcript_20527/g.42573 Transcript_20527/m.42573 type:complete len:377 (+) Transcript_20527:70-1200(+)
MGQVEAREGDSAVGEMLPAGQFTGKSFSSTCPPHEASQAAQAPGPFISEMTVSDSDVSVNTSRPARDCTELNVAERRPASCGHGSFGNDAILDAAPAAAITSASGDAEEEHHSAFRDIGSPCHGQAATACMPRALTTFASAAAGAVTSAAALPKRPGKVLLGHGPRSPKGSQTKVAMQGPRSAAPRTSVVKVVATAARAKKRTEAPVALHVYDASWLAPADSSIPIVHLGVEVYGTEFFFGIAGVQCSKPGDYDPERHRHRLLLGHTKLPKREVYRMLMSLKTDWPGTCYRLIGCNCQTFALTLCECLGLGSCIPEQYVYFAKPWTLAGGVDPSKLIPLTLSGQLGSNLRSFGSAVDGSDIPGGTKLNEDDKMEWI